MAVSCRLANIIPAGRDGNWSEEATDFFIKNVKDKLFSAYIAEKGNESKQISVELLGFDKDNEQIAISDLLVSSNHAISSPEFSTNQVRYDDDDDDEIYQSDYD